MQILLWLYLRVLGGFPDIPGIAKGLRACNASSYPYRGTHVALHFDMPMIGCLVLVRRSKNAGTKAFRTHVRSGG